MTIRPARVTDIDQLMIFQTALARETENVALDQSVLREGLQNLFATASNGQYYVAERDGNVVGCLMTTFEYSEWRDGRVLWIQSVYVDSASRGRGVYKELYSYVRKLVENDPALKGIRLYAEKGNMSAHDVYRKMGMNGDHYIVFEWMKS